MDGKPTLDEWADKHPKFRDNVRITVDQMADLHDEDCANLVRAILQMARQEFGE